MSTKQEVTLDHTNLTTGIKWTNSSITKVTVQLHSWRASGR